MSHSQFHSTNLFILRHAWLNLWDKHMTTGRINQVTIHLHERTDVHSHHPSTEVTESDLLPGMGISFLSNRKVHQQSTRRRSSLGSTNSDAYQIGAPNSSISQVSDVISPSQQRAEITLLIEDYKQPVTCRRSGSTRSQRIPEWLKAGFDHRQVTRFPLHHRQTSQKDDAWLRFECLNTH
jgi:hypothetical protein